MVFHFGSGQAFFSGCALVWLGVGLAAALPRPMARNVAQLLSFAGMAFCVASATPISLVWYALALALWVVWIVLERGVWASRPHMRSWASAALAAAMLVGFLFESPYHFMPWIPPLGEQPFHVVGDSITAGTGESETWPVLLAKKRKPGLVTVSHAKAGATAGSAISQAAALNAQLGQAAGMVLIEIGGNDLLGTTTARTFARDLEALLVELAKPGRTLVMLELPLYPGSNAFGQFQREAAARHGVILVPKRVLMRLLETEGATIDGIHLSAAGRQLMAETIWNLVSDD